MANETTLVFQYIRNDDHQVHDEVVFKQSDDLHNYVYNSFVNVLLLFVCVFVVIYDSVLCI